MRNLRYPLSAARFGQKFSRGSRRPPQWARLEPSPPSFPSPSKIARATENLLLPVIVLLAGWTLSGWIFMLLQGDAARRQEEFFRERVAEAQEALRVRMTSYAD